MAHTQLLIQIYDKSTKGLLYHCTLLHWVATRLHLVKETNSNKIHSPLRQTDRWDCILEMFLFFLNLWQWRRPSPHTLTTRLLLSLDGSVVSRGQGSRYDCIHIQTHTHTFIWHSHIISSFSPVECMTSTCYDLAHNTDLSTRSLCAWSRDNWPALRELGWIASFLERFRVYPFKTGTLGYKCKENTHENSSPEHSPLSKPTINYQQ